MCAAKGGFHWLTGPALIFNPAIATSPPNSAFGKNPDLHREHEELSVFEGRRTVVSAGLA